MPEPQSIKEIAKPVTVSKPATTTAAPTSQYGSQKVLYRTINRKLVFFLVDGAPFWSVFLWGLQAAATIGISNNIGDGKPKTTAKPYGQKLSATGSPSRSRSSTKELER